MDLLSSLAHGFSVILTPENLWWVALGALMGTLVGALPGLGPTAGMSVLLPLAFSMNPTSSLVMLGGIYYGAMYGGTITAVLLKIPGESDAIFTALEGNQMAMRGRGGAALTIAALVSFFAGTVSVVLLMVFAPLLADLALRFGPPEKFAVIALGLVLLSSLMGRFPAKGYLMLGLGLAIATIGIDTVTAVPRFSFGSANLMDGIDFLPVTVGLFGLANVMVNAETQMRSAIPAVPRLRELLPNREEMARSWAPATRGTLLGFLIGNIPGSGTTIGATASYTVEGNRKKRPKDFGRGAVEGIAGPEAANNAVTGGAMVPMLALGIPPSPASAVLLAALLLHGLRPGPGMFDENPDVVWGFIASMYVGNLILLVLNTCFIPAFTKLTARATKILNPLVAALCIVGVFAYRNNPFDVAVMLVFGFIGYVLIKLDYPVAPVVLGVLLGPVAELHLRQSLVISGGSPSIFFTKPIAAVFILAAIAVICISAVRSSRARRTDRSAEPRARSR